MTCEVVPKKRIGTNDDEGMRMTAVQVEMLLEGKGLVEALIKRIVITIIVHGGIRHLVRKPIVVVIPHKTMKKMVVRRKRGNTVGSTAMKIDIVIIVRIGAIVIGTTRIIVLVKRRGTRMRRVKGGT